MFTAFVWLPYRDEHKQEITEAGQTNYEDAVASCAIFSDGVAHSDCIINRLDAQKEQKRAEYDLRAQQEMSEWALLMLIVTSVGVMYVARTLGATELALKQNKKAVEASVKAAEMAERAAFSERPWLCYVGLLCGTDPEKTKGVIQVNWSNVGRAPAHNLTGAFDFKLVDPPLDPKRVPIFDVESNPTMTGIIAPNLAFQSLPAVFNRDQLSDIFNARKILLIYTRINYFGVGDQNGYETEGVLWVRPRVTLDMFFNNGGDQAFSFEPVGNQHTVK